MNTASDDLLLQVAELIAEGKPIDWDVVAREADPGTLARLREISVLSDQFGGLQKVPAASATSDALPIKIWGHLQLKAEIGRGARGVVYRAWDPLLNRAVALKMCDQADSDPAVMLHEAQMMAKVDHPGVLKIHGAALHDRRVGFWSDLIDGESIATRLEREGRFQPQEVIAIGLSLCSALAAIHAHELLHGDVKAQNVMQRSDGRYVLVDFGSSTPMNQRTQVSGTPLYLAPELLLGGPASPADDLYSVGVLLFKMLTATFPVNADSLLGLVDQHRSGTRNHLLDLVPGIDARLAEVIERAISADPRPRFRSAGALSTALRACWEQDHEPVAGTQGAATPAKSRRTLPGYAIAAVLALLLVLVVLFGRNPVQPASGFQARLVRTAGGTDFPLLDGDRVGAGDALSLDLRLNDPGYVYVLNEDAAGAVFQLFPLAMAEQVNPLPANKRLRLPGRVAGRDLEWIVTSPGARERFYVLVSPQEISELALAATGFAQAELGRPIDRSALIAAGRTTRGIGGLSESSQSGTQFDWRVGAWLSALQQQHIGTSLQQFELQNPE